MSLAGASARVAPAASLRGSAFGRKLSKSTASRVSRRRAVSVTAGAPMKTVDEAKELLDRQGYKMLDIRPFKAYDREHLTKPPQCTVNCPVADGDDPSALAAKCESMGLRPGAKLLVADFDGDTVQAAADALFAAGYVDVVAVEGGYNGWRRVFTTCGRRRPPQGKWISTGAGGESLKSGLTLDPNVAAAYEENWGKEPPKHGERGESLAERTKGERGACRKPARVHERGEAGPSRPSRWTRRSTGSARRRAITGTPAGRARRSRTARRGARGTRSTTRTTGRIITTGRRGRRRGRSPTAGGPAGGGWIGSEGRGEREARALADDGGVARVDLLRRFE